MLSAGVQRLVARSHRAGNPSRVAQSVPGAVWRSASPGCSMTKVPLAIPLKRQGAVTARARLHHYLGRPRACLQRTAFTCLAGEGSSSRGLVVVAVRGLGWGSQLFGKPLLGRVDIDETSSLRHAGAAPPIPTVLPGRRSFWATLSSTNRNLVPILPLGLFAAASASVLIGKGKSNNGWAAA